MILNKECWELGKDSESSRRSCAFCCQLFLHITGQNRQRICLVLYLMLVK